MSRLSLQLLGLICNKGHSLGGLIKVGNSSFDLSLFGTNMPKSLCDVFLYHGRKTGGCFKTCLAVEELRDCVQADCGDPCSGPDLHISY